MGDTENNGKLEIVKEEAKLYVKFLNYTLNIGFDHSPKLNEKGNGMVGSSVILRYLVLLETKYKGYYCGRKSTK